MSWTIVRSAATAPALATAVIASRIVRTTTGHLLHHAVVQIPGVATSIMIAAVITAAVIAATAPATTMVIAVIIAVIIAATPAAAAMIISAIVITTPPGTRLAATADHVQQIVAAPAAPDMACAIIGATALAHMAGRIVRPLAGKPWRRHKRRRGQDGKAESESGNGEFHDCSPLKVPGPTTMAAR